MRTLEGLCGFKTCFYIKECLILESRVFVYDCLETQFQCKSPA